MKKEIDKRRMKRNFTAVCETQKKINCLFIIKNDIAMRTFITKRPECIKYKLGIWQINLE